MKTSGTPQRETSGLRARVAAATATQTTIKLDHIEGTITMTTIIRRSYLPDAAPFTKLPFIADIRIKGKKRRCFWSVPKTDDYGHANSVGRQYACDYLQYLKDNPGWAGGNITGDIVRDMVAHPLGSDMNGYAVGFWSTLEEILLHAVVRVDHWAIAQQIQDRYDKILAARASEEMEEGNE